MATFEDTVDKNANKTANPTGAQPDTTPENLRQVVGTNDIPPLDSGDTITQTFGF